MRKIIMTVLAGFALTLGLAAAPANSAPGEITLFDQTGGQGETVDVLEADIPSACAAIPQELDVVWSGVNQTNTTAAFYTNSDCTSHVGTISAGMPGDLSNGALFWKATTS